MKRIIKNKAICLKCKTELESKDDSWVECKCGSLSISGGNKSLKRHFNVKFARCLEWEDTSTVEK